MSTFTVQITDISVDRKSIAKPDMIEVILDETFLLKAHACIAFMQQQDVSYMCCRHEFDYTFYQLVTRLDESALNGRKVVMGRNNGKQYVEVQPEDRLEGCHAKIFKDGTIQAEFPFPDVHGTMWIIVARDAPDSGPQLPMLTH